MEYGFAVTAGRIPGRSRCEFPVAQPGCFSERTGHAWVHIGRARRRVTEQQAFGVHNQGSMHLNLKRSLLALMAIAAFAASLRFQRVLIDEGPGIRTYTRWRILLPLQSGSVDLPFDGYVQTDEYAFYGLG